MLHIVEDYRMKGLEKLITMYNNKHLDNAGKYSVYLKIRDIKEKYFGRYNRVFPTITEAYKSFFAIYGENHYTEAAKKEYINKLESYLFMIDKIEFNANNELYLNGYEKSILAFNYKCNRNVSLEYNCSLISLKIRSGCKSSIKNKETREIYKILSHEYLKKDITFNFLKSDIEYLIIKDMDNAEVKLTVKEFEKMYSDIKWFLYKELYEQDMELIENIGDERLKLAFKLIREHVGLRNMPNIHYKDKLDSEKTLGTYFLWNIFIKEKENKNETKIEVIIHELGHFIHEAVLNNKQVRFPVKDKSDYAKRNYFENFAECFTDLICANIINDRTKKMIDILQEII